MPTEIADLDVEKNRIVHDLFIHTADDNYIAARWCYAESLNVDFHWLAVHALEKYMKAALLLNGRSSKKHGHDIGKLYAEVQKFAADLLPTSLDQPALVSLPHWRAETPEAYLARLYKSGNAHNRYQVFGYSMHFEDIYKLDRMIFAIRRLCCFLDAYYLTPLNRQEMKRLNPSRNCDFSFRDRLARDPDSWERMNGHLERAIDGRGSPELQRIVLNHNIAFAPTKYEHGDMPIRVASHTPVLWRAIIDPLTRDFSDEAKKRAAETCKWAIANIKLPDDVVAELTAITSKSP